MTVIDHKQLAENESPASVTITADNLAVIGTTVAPGTGGEQLAKTTSLMIYDIVTKKLLWKQVFSDKAVTVTGLYALPNGKVIAVDGTNRLFLFNVKTREIEITNNVEYGSVVGAQGPRIFMADGDKIYILLNTGLGLLDTEKCTISRFYNIPDRISTGGGIHNGVFYYISGVNWKSAAIE